MWELFVATACFTLFAVAVTALLYFWPREPEVLLDKQRKKVQILDIRDVSHDTKLFRLSTGDKHTPLGLPAGKDLTIYAPNPPECLQSGRWNGKEDRDKGKAEVFRTYTPITGNATVGYVDLLIKRYSSDGKDWPQGGKVSQYLHSQQPGDFIEVSGPNGKHQYLGRGMFKAYPKTLSSNHICMIAAGTGLTPFLQLVRESLQDSRDRTTLTLLYANKTEEDILMRDELNSLAEGSNGRFRVHYTLDQPPQAWKGFTGLVTAAMIQAAFVSPAKKPLMLVCGPPPMMVACHSFFKDLKYPQELWITFGQ